MTQKEGYALMEALVTKFEQNIDQYKNLSFNETETRNEFIDLFWEALGWDMQNKAQNSPTYKEVQVEKTQKTEGKNKKPDYAFRGNLYQNTFFYAEAKKPSVNLKHDIAPLLQVKNYGWQGKLKISIVMDFEEFVIVNTTKAPRKNDTLKNCTHQYLTYKDYLPKFDFFWNTFGKEAVNKGSIEIYTKNIQETPSKESVDVNFLNTLETWRKYLATDIAQKNKELHDFELNTLVQQTIDRIIFLKITEDRNIELPNQLLETTKKGNIYQNLLELFFEADIRYNSGLFNFKKNNIAQNAKIDNKILKNILKELYEGNEDTEFLAYPYDFSIIPVEILGYAYEQFLGNVIVIDQKGTAIITQKAEVRKAGGVYYTPVEVVRYIVQETIGKKIAEKTPNDILEMTCLDPSCGSGSFLLGAYDYLLKWYLEYYISLTKTHKKIPELTPNMELTTQTKKDILVRHIFGVDIDEQAVEVTKLSLLIKCLEGETKASIETQNTILKQKVLPSLEDNILCGNSLISANFYDGKLFPTPREMRKINVFDWNVGFKNQLKKGGFEIIIGNPPYGATFDDAQKQYLKTAYPTSDIEIESYLIFIEKAFYLLKNKGFCSFIIPSNLLTNMRYDKTRLFLLKNTDLQKILDLGGNVFKQASVDTCILVFGKEKKQNHIVQTYVGDFVKTEKTEENKNEKTENRNEIIILDYKEFSQTYFEKSEGGLFNIYSSEESEKITLKIAQNKELLTNLVKFARGVEFGYSSEHITTNKKLKKAKPIIAGRCIEKYALHFENKYVLFEENDTKIFKDKSIYENNKILMRRIGHDIVAVFDDQQYYNVCDVYNILAKNGTNLKYILAILNSKLMSFFLKTKFNNSKKLFPKIPIAYLEQLPIKILDLKNKLEKKQLDDILLLVENIQQAHKNLAQNANQHDKNMYERLIIAVSNQIDEMVYKIYDLTPDEIVIINGE